MSLQLINMPIIFTIPFDIDEYKISPFYFINTESKNMNLKRKKLCTIKIVTMEYDVEYIFKDLITEKYIISIIIIFWIIVM